VRITRRRPTRVEGSAPLAIAFITDRNDSDDAAAAAWGLSAMISLGVFIMSVLACVQLR
jgi:hypothetical protein